MKRRDFIQAGAGGLLALAATPRLAGQFGPPPPPLTYGKGPLKVDVYSRHLQWLRTADEVAEAAIEMDYQGVDITVRPYPGHVDPARVKTDLPPFVKAIRSHGLEVVTVTCPITDADSPYAEDILSTCADLDIHHYWWGTFRYSFTQPVMAQLDALKPRVAKLARLNAKYGMTAMYHTYHGDFLIGNTLWDMLHVLKEFDPKQVGFHYDLGHMTVSGAGGAWVTSLRAAGPYIAGLSIKDYAIENTFHSPEGGPMSPQVEKNLQLQRGFFFGPPGRGRGGRGGRGGARGPAGPLAERGPAPAAAGRGGRGPGRGEFTRPAGYLPGFKTNWNAIAVPLNTGMVDLPTFATILKEINFNGPVEIQSEYPNGGANNAATTLTLPRAIVLGNMKRDLVALRMQFAASGLLSGPTD